MEVCPEASPETRILPHSSKLDNRIQLNYIPDTPWTNFPPRFEKVSSVIVTNKFDVSECIQVEPLAI